MSEREKLNYQFLCEIEKTESAVDSLSVIDGVETSVESIKLMLGRLTDEENFRPINRISGRFFLDTYTQVKEALKTGKFADYSPETRFYCWRDGNVRYFGSYGYSYGDKPAKVNIKLYVDPGEPKKE